MTKKATTSKESHPILSGFVKEFERFLEDYAPVEPGREINPVEALFAYRLLLSRNPDLNVELSAIKSKSQTRREYLSLILDSAEFSKTGGFFPAGQLLMSETNGFRFWFNTSDREMGVPMAMGMYEPESAAFLKKVVQPGMTCLDIGAQTGYYTCLLAVAVGGAGKVYAFEPMPQSFELLARNVQENGFSDRVQMYPRAASNQTGQIQASMISGMYVASHVEGTTAITMDCVRVDDIIADKIDLIKIDVEGHEPAVLEGMRSLIARSHPIILTEINEYWLHHSSNSSGDAYLSLLRSLGYSIYSLDDRSTPLGPLALDELDILNVVALPSAA